MYMHVCVCVTANAIRLAAQRAHSVCVYVASKHLKNVSIAIHTKWPDHHSIEPTKTQNAYADI